MGRVGREGRGEELRAKIRWSNDQIRVRGYSVLELSQLLPPAQEVLRRTRYGDAVLAIKLLEPMIEDEDAGDEPIDLVERLCRIIVSAMQWAPDGDAWTYLWEKFSRWETTLSAWRGDA